MSRRLPNWIQAYLAYTHESEAPEEFHRWIALSIIAGALRRQVFFNMGYFLLYPNLYVVLVSPAGKCKKSTAMRVGRSALEPVEGIKYSSDSTTRERLIQDLSQSYSDGHSSMSAFSSEFASLLTNSGMDMVIFLTDVYDSPPEWTHRTKTGGTNKIMAPCLNLLGATTPEWLGRALPLDTVGIGLTSRIIFVYSSTPRVRDPFPTLSPEQTALYQLLVEDLAAISTINGEYVLANDTKEYYREWYKKRIENPNPTGDPRLSGYFERKPMHLLKVAMSVAASQRNETIITLGDLTAAMTIMEFTENFMPKVFASVGKNPLSMDIQDIENVIYEIPGVTIDVLLNRFRHSLRKDELIEVLEHLQMGKKITQIKTGYYPIKEES